MSLLDYFRAKPKPSANLAKERLQVVIAHQRAQRGGPDYLPMLKQDLLAVIRKYVEISESDVQVQFDHQENCDVLELNVILPER